MVEKELKNMKRADLVEIIYALQQNEESLQQEILTLQEKLDDRAVKIKNAGSIADAVVSLNQIFQTAQDTADQYIESVRATKKNAEEEAGKMLSEARQEANRILKEAEEHRHQMETEADQAEVENREKEEQ